MTASYAWHARFLLHLQVDHACAHWVLKAPAHLAYVKCLVAQYPDASIIWTHRRPLEAIASFSSLTHTLRSGFSNTVEPLASGAQEFQHFSKVALRAVEDRRALDRGQFIDVSFNAICADPIAVVSTVYEHLKRELTRGAEERMRPFCSAPIVGTHKPATPLALLFAKHGTASWASKPVGLRMMRPTVRILYTE